MSICPKGALPRNLLAYLLNATYSYFWIRISMGYWCRDTILLPRNGRKTGEKGARGEGAREGGKEERRGEKRRKKEEKKKEEEKEHKEEGEWRRQEEEQGQGGGRK